MLGALKIVCQICHLFDTVGASLREEQKTRACVHVHVWGRKHQIPHLRVWAKMKTPPSSSNTDSDRGWEVWQIFYPKSHISVILLNHTVLGRDMALECSFQHEMYVWGLPDVILTIHRLSISRVPLCQVPAEKEDNLQTSPRVSKPPLGWDESSPGDATSLPSDYRGTCTTLLEQPQLLWLTGVNPIPFPVHCPTWRNRSCQTELTCQDPKACGKSQFPPLLHPWKEIFLFLGKKNVYDALVGVWAQAAWQRLALPLGTKKDLSNF